MSYNPEFTNISSVSALTGETIDDTSDPNTSQVLEWIEEVETDMVGKGYSTQAFTSITMDIPEGDADHPYNVLKLGKIYSDRIVGGGKVVTLPHTPFISVTNVKRNTQGYEQAASWEDLVEGPGSDTDFLIIKQPYRPGLRGTALYFYRNAPYAGYQRLQLDYTWGYDLPETVLREYATNMVALKFLYSKYLRKEPLFDVDVAGMRTKLNPFTNVHQGIIDRIEAIKTEWLPSEWVGAAMKP